MACGPEDIYKALLAAGFSTNQAVGAMANGIAESGLNPETRDVDSNGYYSNGIWQFNEETYPNSGSLITGNCTADISAQVGLLKSSASGSALSGSSAGEVAGNFAQYFERCSTCQPGDSSYDQRVANAATVAGWVSSGKWPVSSAGLSGAGSASSAAATGPDCAFGPKLPLVGQICLMKKATIRHAAGVSLMAAGGTVGLVGVLVLVAFAFRASGAARVAGQVAGAVPGGAPLRAFAASARRPAQAAPDEDEVITERAPIEDEDEDGRGGTRETTTRRTRRGGRESSTSRIVERTPGGTPGSTRTRTYTARTGS